jgi:hypothetical protein
MTDTEYKALLMYVKDGCEDIRRIRRSVEFMATVTLVCIGLVVAAVMLRILLGLVV